MNKACALGIVTAGALWCGCSLQPMAGGSSQQGNGIVVGTVVDNAGYPVWGANVSLVPSEYNPVSDPAIPDSCFGSTDTNGRYSIKISRTGSFNIEVEAVLRNEIIKSLVPGIMVQKTRTVNVRTAILQSPGAIMVEPVGIIDTTTGYVFLTGTTCVSPVSGSITVVRSVPAGNMFSVMYTKGKDSASKVVQYNVQVNPGDTTTISNPSWRHMRRIYLNTSRSGADVAGNVLDFPVLLRLSRNDFPFEQVRPDVADFEFTDSKNSPLEFEIVRWDAANGAAELWVRIDTVFGNSADQFIVMYWGPPAGVAVQESNSAAVFDTAQGFQAVWHLAETAGAIAHDATANHFDGTMTRTAQAPGIAGSARKFNGYSSFIEVPNSSAGRMDFLENGHYTLSAWVYADSLDSAFHQIISKGERQYGLMLHNINRWEITEFHENIGWQTVRAPAAARVWTFIAGVRDGRNEYLYVNGVKANDSISTWKARGRDSSFNVCIGRMSNGSKRFWNGMLDEVCVANVARSSDWILLAYRNQKTPDQLVEFR